MKSARCCHDMELMRKHCGVGACDCPTLCGAGRDFAQWIRLGRLVLSHVACHLVGQQALNGWRITDISDSGEQIYRQLAGLDVERVICSKLDLLTKHRRERTWIISPPSPPYPAQQPTSSKNGPTHCMGHSSRTFQKSLSKSDPSSMPSDT